MAGLLDWLSKQKDSAMNDYAGLMDNYPNAQKFGNGLINNISQHIPSNEDFKSPEAMRDWSTAAALNAPMGLTFIGKNAANWNPVKAAEAEKLLNAGVDPAEVWKSHLIGRMPDKSLFSEIDDSKANMLPLEKDGVSYSADKAISHDDLLNNYPDLSNLYFSKGNSTYYSPEMNHIKIEKLNTTTGENPLIDDAQTRLTGLANRLDEKGMLNNARENKLDVLWNGMYLKYPDVPTTKTFDKSSALHELQHAIQEREGWAKGGNPGMFDQQKEAELARDALSWRRELLNKRKEMPKADWYHVDNELVQDYQKQGIFDWVPSREARDLASQPYILHADKYDNGAGLKDLEDLVKMYGLDKNTSPYKPMDGYRRLTGEAQARATQDRMNMDMQQRRDTYPLAGGLLSDIPLDQLINRYR